MKYLPKIVVAAIISLVIAVFIQIHKGQLAEIRKLEGVVSEQVSVITYYKNENKKIVAQKEAVEIEARDLKKMYPEIYNSIKKDFDIKVRDLKAYVRSEIQAVGTGKADINYYTTVNNEKAGELSMDDGYLSFKASLDSAGSVYSYSYVDTIKQTISVKKKWLIGNEKLYGSATLSNPSARVVNSQSILINEYRDKRFGLGPAVFYDPFSGTMRFGFGVQYNLIRW